MGDTSYTMEITIKPPLHLVEKMSTVKERHYSLNMDRSKDKLLQATDSESMFTVTNVGGNLIMTMQPGFYLIF